MTQRNIPTDSASATPATNPSPHRRRQLLKRILRGSLWTALAIFLLASLGAIVWLRGALYNRWVRFPAEAAAVAAFREQRQAFLPPAGWNEYRGILHSHSELSHDSEVPFPEILDVLKKTETDFICLSDHCTEGLADFSAQWRGLRDGKLFIPGFEMKNGIMPFGVDSAVVLTNSTDPSLLAEQIITHGGVLFYAHPEEPRAWDEPRLTGMEIYNTHTDFKDEGKPLAKLLPDLLVNYRRFPDQVTRTLFDRPTAILRNWDRLNATRHITGIAGNDCHQNTGLRVFYTPAGTLRIEDTSPETVAEFKLNFLTRPLVRLAFGKLTPGRLLFRFQLDPYARMGRFVRTHVLARELTEAAVLDSLRAGRAFIGFDLLADSSTFLWFAEESETRAVMGESLPFSPAVRLEAAAPHSGRFTLIQDGRVIRRDEGRRVSWTPSGPGKYRVEVELKIRDEWVPWIYANPIHLISVETNPGASANYLRP